MDGAILSWAADRQGLVEASAAVSSAQWRTMGAAGAARDGCCGCCVVGVGHGGREGFGPDRTGPEPDRIL